MYSYDPFGQPVDAVTGRIGTLTADDTVPDSLPGNADTGWVGQHQKLYEHAGSIATIEMGARPYMPALGRFLGVDPIEGGNTTDYGYPGDPINSGDFTGRSWWSDLGRAITDSGAGQAILFACGFIPGWISVGCGVVETLAYVAQGRVGDAAVALVGAAAGFVGAKAAMKAMTAAAKGAIAAKTASLTAQATRRSLKAARSIARDINRGNEWLSAAVANAAVAGAAAPAHSWATVWRLPGGLKLW